MGFVYVRGVLCLWLSRWVGLGDGDDDEGRWGIIVWLLGDFGSGFKLLMDCWKFCFIRGEWWFMVWDDFILR